MLLRPALLLFLAYNTILGLSQTIIKTLPGFPGNLPFKLETGYIGVGELDDVQLFYYFIESERSPKDDPLILWLTGGPGCSSFSGLVYEIGPLTFDYLNSIGEKPQFYLKSFSWTKVANIIFLDQPVGTGFSYATSWASYFIDNTISAKQTYAFLRKWLMAHPNFLTNPLYIAGDSYSGKFVPVIVQEISEGIDDGHEPPMNLSGYFLGNPVTDENKDTNSKVPFFHLKNLISDEIFESAKRNCKGEYVDVDPKNAPCINDLQRVEECTEKINPAQILEPICITSDYKYPRRPMKLNSDRGFLMEDDKDFLLAMPQLPRQWCRDKNNIGLYIWANDKTVQEALHVREGTKEEWVRCNKSLSYTENIPSTVVYHQELIKRGYRILIYSGDHDSLISYVGTRGWINSLNLTVSSDWQPWFVDGQVAGYVIQYSYKKSTLAFTTVKGAGHTAPEYKPKECLAMISRWLADYPI